MSTKRQQIEAAATRAIQKDGIRAVSFRTLADEVGVKSASVHYHFPTKADLAHAVVQGYSARFFDMLENIGAENETLRDKLEALVDGFEAVLARQDFCLCGMMAAELTSLDDLTRGALKRFFEDTEAWLLEQFARHADEIDSPLAPELLAAMIVAGLEGALLLDLVSGSETHLDAQRAYLRTLT